MIKVPGRPGHAEVRQPGWREGGAVNAIEKSAIVMAAMDALRHAGRDARARHPLLSAPSLLPTMAAAASGRSPTRPRAS